MSNLIVEPVASDIEFAGAYELALSVFKENSSNEDYAAYKIESWTKDPSFNYNNILLARYGNDYAGLIRIVSRKLFRGEQFFSVAGISSVCLLPAFRGKGLSIPLMEQSLAFCKKREYDIAFLFARRAADYYYTKFGFHGVAAFARVLVKNNRSISIDNRFSLTEINEALTDLYAKAYERSYFNCFGRIDRTETYWHFILSLIKARKDCMFKTICSNGMPIGYLIYNKQRIHEIAFDREIDGPALVYFLLNQNIFDSQTNTLELELLPQHLLIGSLRNLDITFQSRECNYGGHMLKIINTQKMNDVFSPAKDMYTYQETCSMMGIYSPVTDQGVQSEKLPFDISYIDQF